MSKDAECDKSWRLSRVYRRYIHALSVPRTTATRMIYTYHPRVQLASTTNTVPVPGTKVSCLRYKVPRGTHSSHVDIIKVSRLKEDSSRTPVSAAIDATSDTAADIIRIVNGKRLGSVPF